MEQINNMKQTSRYDEVSPRRRGSNLLIILLFFALILQGCKDDDKLDMDNPTPDTFNGTVTAKVENGASYEAEISTVWALYDATTNSAGQLNGRMLATGDYTNGGFTINMTEIPASFLMNVQTFFATVLNVSGELDIDEPDARMLSADFFGIASDNTTYVDFFTYSSTGSKRTTCLFIYVDSNVTIKDGKSISVAFQKGWNRMYVTPSDRMAVSKAPKDLKWYLNKDLK